MKCEVNPELPNVYYRWKKDGTIISSGQIYHILSFQPRDIGSYSCEIVDSTGSNNLVGLQTSESVLVRFQTGTSRKIGMKYSYFHNKFNTNFIYNCNG